MIFEQFIADGDTVSAVLDSGPAFEAAVESFTNGTLDSLALMTASGVPEPGGSTGSFGGLGLLEASVLEVRPTFESSPDFFGKTIDRIEINISEVSILTLPSALCTIPGFGPCTDYSFEFSASLIGLDGVVATQTVVLGGPLDPAALIPAQVGSQPGEDWTPRVDHSTFLPGAVADLLFLSSQSASLGTPLGQLLIDPAVALGVPVFAPAPGAPFEVAIPNDVRLIGQTAIAQALSIDLLGGAELTNALSITIGNL